MPKALPDPARKKRRQKMNQKREQNMETAKRRKKQQKVEPSEDTSSQDYKVVKVTSAQQAKWQPLPKSERELLESMIHWLIVSLLYETTQHYSETEKHLNHLKKRLQACLKTLRVPVEKLSSLNNVHKILTEERKKSIDIEKGLAHLQKELTNILTTAGFREENIKNLQERVQKLKCELAAEEAAAKELFQRDGDVNLVLPDISKNCLKAPILQDEILKTANQESLLNDLHTIQQSEEMKAMSTFFEEAHDFMDRRN